MTYFNRRLFITSLLSSLRTRTTHAQHRTTVTRGEPEFMRSEISRTNNVLFFSGFETGNIEDGSWARTFGAMPKSNDRLTAESGCNKYSKRSLCVNLKAGTYGPENGLVFAPYFRSMNLENFEEIFFQYSVKFGRNMSGRAGGKLPGLASAGTFAAEGCQKVSGHEGWSARYVFGGTTVDGPIHMIAYPYVVNSEEISRPFRKNIKCGGFVPLLTSSFDRGGSHSYHEFRRDRWYAVCQRVKLNDVGQNNGVLQIFVDGQIVADRQNIVYRLDLGPHNLIGRIFFEVFHGGDDASWAPERDETICFDDLILSRKPVWL